MNLLMKRLKDQAELFTRGSSHAAAWDIYYVGPNIALYPGRHHKFDTGIATAFNCNYVGIIKGRSGLASKGICVLGGVIDSDYRGEWKVILANCGQDIVTFEQGDRIAQVVFQETIDVETYDVLHLPESERGEQGFGSTGR